MQAFRDALSECELEEMGSTGAVYTWSRGPIKERLDRAICNLRWNLFVPHAGVVTGEMTKSDHRPLVIDTDQYA